MEQDLAALQPGPGMAGAAVEVRAARAQAVRLVDRRETVNINCRANYPVFFNFKKRINYA